MARKIAPPRSADARPASLSSVAAGLLLAPLAWFAQMVIAETLAAQSCFPVDHPLSAPHFAGMRAVLMGISLACLLVGVAGALISWRNFRRIACEQANVAKPPAGPADFLTRIAVMCNALFLFGLIATDVALAIVSPCAGW
jgi:hypothetical protein